MTNQQLLERASAQVRSLADSAGVRPIAMAVDMAGVGADLLPSLLGHELVAGHAAMMRLTAKLDHFLAMIAPDRSPEEQDRVCRQAVQLSGAAARLTERYRLGLMSLARLERWSGAGATRRPAWPADPAEEPDDDPFDDGPHGGARKSPAKVLAELQALNRAAGAMLNGAKSNGNGTHPQAPPHRGRLRHGNPSGDFRAAARCGAKTRADCPCRQPAMSNGRCRFHGGKSTGARTAAGFARCRTAGLVHGHRTAEIIELKSAAARHGRALHALTRAAHALSLPQSERPTPCPATSPPTPPFMRHTGTADERRWRQMNADAMDATRHRRFATSALIPADLRSSAVELPSVRSCGRSERATPCPATPRRAAAG